MPRLTIDVMEFRIINGVDVPESKPVPPVAIEQVEAVRAVLTRVLRGMVDLELVTGMRPQEVRNITWGQIGKSDPKAWCYTPNRHKTKRKGKSRKIFIGPNGQSILNDFLRADPDAFIFSPRDSEEERSIERRANRKSPMTPSQAASAWSQPTECSIIHRFDLPTLTIR